MKTLYFECNMGAAGDMIMAALLELHSKPTDFLNRLNNVGIPNTNITAEQSIKCGIKGTHITVTINGEKEEGHHHHHHHHSNFHTTQHLIEHLNISETVKKNALAVYKLLAEAESQVHGVPVEQIHFHEVGEMDAVADIVGVCMLMEELAPELVLASPVNVGSGQVKCAHGILPVPAPATALILQNIPIYSDSTNGELCTPTGAALLKYFAKEFCKMPVMKVAGLGYGMGKKDFEKANCLRAYIGETDNASEEVIELVCNLDDITPEALAFAQQLLLDKGALDVYTTPIIMKKGRAGFSFTCMCKLSDREKMLQLIFKHTTTLGVREYSSNRHTLQREQTEFGSVKIKTSQGFGVRKSKLEYEDVAALAKKHELSIVETEAHIKYERLKNYLQELGSVVIAFSGGVDSTFLLKTAHDILGDRAIAATARSCSFPKRELDEAAAFCKKEDITHIIFNSEEMNIEGFSKNSANRCYLCKRELFTKILTIAKEHKILHIAEGSNKDDEGDYRPGLTAVAELGIKSPLRYAELNKQEIRHLSKEMNLHTWNKQSFACLSSRFPYGEEINSERLDKIDKAEQFLLDTGFHQVRVRYHGNLARIETDEDGFALMSSQDIREKIQAALKELGFTYVALDLLGYRTGSMNDTLKN